MRPDHTDDFEPVAQAEAHWIEQRRKASDVADSQRGHVGLALSGGGVRSAIFNLGVLQALEARGVLAKIDYLSSVSGGGYIASCLSWLRAHLEPEPKTSLFSAPISGEKRSVLDWLRAHGRYLIDGPGSSSWSLAAAILAGTIVNLALLGPILLLAIAAATLEWLAWEWPNGLMPLGLPPLEGHDGYILLLALGLLCLVLFVVAALGFAVVTGMVTLRKASTVLWFRRVLAGCLLACVVFIALGLIPVFGSLEEALIRHLGDDGWTGLIRHGTYLAPMITGLLTMARYRRRSGLATALGLSLLLYGILIGAYQLSVHTELLSFPAFWAWAALSLALAFIIDVNWISMHSYYQVRLAKAFLPPVDPAGADPLRFGMGNLSPERGCPYLLINTTMNTSSDKRRLQQARHGASFVLAPLYCGSTATGYRRTDDYLGGKLPLATAFSVSGAAVDPDMTQTASRSVSFLMTLLNVRLGYWVTNPRRRGRRVPVPRAWLLLLREMLGLGLAPDRYQIHLADGGHFDNLGLYELLRRRCAYIISCDAGEDSDLTFAALGSVIERARVDFGAEVNLPVDRLLDSDSPQGTDPAYLRGSVRYADGSKGEILYLKARMRAHFSADIFAYWRRCPPFPNQSTVDQFFDEAQFEAYRELGRQTTERMLGDAPFGGMRNWFRDLGNL